MSILGLGTATMPLQALSPLTPRAGKLAGYLIPYLINPALKTLFETFFGEKGNTTSTGIVQKGIFNINTGDYQVSKAYKEHYEMIVRPAINKQRLNGVGLNGDNYDLKKSMNDDRAKASTPVHAIKDLKHFDRQIWSTYCDIADLQGSDYSDKIYINPQDNRPDKYKGTTWIFKRHSYLMYNPKYYCFGLPIENPQLHNIDYELRKKVYQKTLLQTTGSHYYTQRYFFQGAGVCNNPQEKITTIYWDHDDAIRKYFNLKKIRPCGDPTIECATDNHIARPDIKP